MPASGTAPRADVGSMFLLSPDRSTSLRTLEKLRASLNGVDCGPVALIEAGPLWLGWFRARTTDNLHVYPDAFVVGKVRVGEEGSPLPQRHDGAPPVPSPLTRSATITVTEGSVRVVPHGVTNVFTDGRSTSDMQLLLADAASLEPSPEGVAILSGVGYFPGTLSLFASVTRIPLMHMLVLPSARLESLAAFRVRSPDDDAMVERFGSLVPKGDQAVAVSGGYDSRFVLALLRNAGQRPTLVHLSDREDPTVARLANEVGLPLRIVPDIPESPDPDRYTLMTDGQIYHRGGHYGRLRGGPSSESIVHLGLFADCVLKNAFRAAWKIPRLKRDLWGRLVDHALLSRVQPVMRGLRAHATRAEMRKLLRDRIPKPAEDSELRGSKERACWFYYLHRGLRWTAAHLADLEFYAEPVCVLSDLTGLSYGIRSSRWANFGHDRVRALNHRLLPSVSVGYSDGGSVVAPPGLRGTVRKVRYEFLDRGLAYFRGRKAAKPRAGPASPRPSVGESPRFRRYFDADLDSVLSKDGYAASLRRAAVTVNSVLRYLERPV